ncbi:MAG: DUF4174 domain-containing protein [Verrucomicrobiota bacterium]
MSEAQSLAELKWKKRLVIGSVENPLFLAQLRKEISKNQIEVRERKLFFLIHSDQEWSIYGSKNAPSEAVLAEVRKRLGDADLALIGLDGGTKERFRKEDFSLQVVFELIDRMPMRREELRRESEEGRIRN